MKKFLICAVFVSLAFSNNSFSQDLKLMRPVKLKNPENENLGFKTPVPTFTNTSVVSVNKKVQPKPVVVKEEKTVKVDIVESVPSVKPEAKVEEPVQIQESVDIKDTIKVSEQTEKNINDARELLKAAERLANSVKDEKDLMEEDEFNIASNEVKKESVNIVVNFTKNQEEVSKNDTNKILTSINKKLNNPETYFKIISYYDNPENRNIAFSRLLNTRKILLDKGVKTSQTMIMVLEDDTKNKSNTVEIIFN